MSSESGFVNLRISGVLDWFCAKTKHKQNSAPPRNLKTHGLEYLADGMYPDHHFQLVTLGAETAVPQSHSPSDFDEGLVNLLVMYTYIPARKKQIELLCAIFCNMWPIGFLDIEQVAYCRQLHKKIHSYSKLEASTQPTRMSAVLSTWNQ